MESLAYDKGLSHACIDDLALSVPIRVIRG